MESRNEGRGLRRADTKKGALASALFGEVISRGGLQLSGDELLQLHDVRGEFADALGGFLRGHGVIVQ